MLSGAAAKENKSGYGLCVTASMHFKILSVKILKMSVYEIVDNAPIFLVEPV